MTGTVEVVRETAMKVLGVPSGQRKCDKEAWWWNKEVEESIQRKRLGQNKWDSQEDEESRQLSIGRPSIQQRQRLAVSCM